MKCKKCGNELPDNSIFCTYCGSKLKLRNFKETVSSHKLLVFFIILTIILIVFSITTMIINLKIIVNLESNNTFKNAVNVNNEKKSNITIAKEKNINEETVEKILKCWQKVSNYGTENIKEVLFENEGTPSDGLFIIYTNYSKKGLYVTSWLRDDINTTVHYGEDPAFTGAKQNYQESTAGYFGFKRMNENNIYFTGTEFIRFLKEEL